MTQHNLTQDTSIDQQLMMELTQQFDKLVALGMMPDFESIEETPQPNNAENKS